MSVEVLGTHELRPAFARHETFHPRYGWLRKAYDAALRGPDEFTRDDATARLGVGKNMVRAIRYWGLAYKVIVEERAPGKSRLMDVVPTRFGHDLLGERDGWDPYLEEPGSLWLLHWQLLRPEPECRAPAWWAIFNSPRLLEFSDESLLGELKRFRDETPEVGDVADSSLDKDVRCLLRMYGSVTQGRDLPEDSIDSPFAELGLIRAAPAHAREWAVNRGAKRNLPDAIVAWSCLDYAHLIGTDARTISLSSLTQAPGSPGRIFALTESSLADALARFTERDDALRLSHAAGVRQLILPDGVRAAASSILSGFYGKRRSGRET